MSAIEKPRDIARGFIFASVIYQSGRCFSLALSAPVQQPEHAAATREERQCARNWREHRLP
jgi:hypothetical protein